MGEKTDKLAQIESPVLIMTCVIENKIKIQPLAKTVLTKVFYFDNTLPLGSGMICTAV